MNSKFPAYFSHENMLQNYYTKETSEALMNITGFWQNFLFVITCSSQLEALKSSTVDIKIAFETCQTAFPAKISLLLMIVVQRTTL